MTPPHPCDLYAELRQLYDAANTALFAGVLPPCMLVLRPKKRASGWFAPACWGHAQHADIFAIDMICLNATVFNAHDAAETLSTLVHEMAHLWQAHHGVTPPRPGYHNREWAQQMATLGLMPSSTGQPGGKQTGMRMAEYVLEHGAFARWLTALQASRTPDTPLLAWHEQPRVVLGRTAVKKVKYTCDGCDVRAWAVEDTALLCGHCRTPLVPALVQLPLLAAP